MMAPTHTASLVIPERIWFANTDMKSFHEVERAPGDASAFRYWLDAGRLFVTPNARKPLKYHNALAAMRPGDAVFAYENDVGFVAIGWVCGPKDLRDSQGGTALYPNPREMVRLLAVDWDVAVTRTAQDVAQHAPVQGPALRECSEGALYDYMVGMLQEANCRHVTDPDANEAATLARITVSPAYDAKARMQLIQARLGQGRFRKAVLAREPACRLTGITQQSCLVASHIKPWAVCVGNEHLDGANGLMLAPHCDHLFDTGLISFEDTGQLLLAPTLDVAILRAWHIEEQCNVGPFTLDQTRYLKYHRDHVFGRNRARRQRNVVGDVPERDLTGLDLAALVIRDYREMSLLQTKK